MQMKQITFKPCTSTLKQFKSFCAKVAEELGKIKAGKVGLWFCHAKMFGSPKKFVTAAVIATGTKRFWLVQHKALNLSNVIITVRNVQSTFFGPGSKLHGIVSIEPSINTPERIAKFIGDVFDNGISSRIYPVKESKSVGKSIWIVKQKLSCLRGSNKHE